MCPYCIMDGNSNHELHCPNNQMNRIGPMDNFQYGGGWTSRKLPYGWECPNCHNIYGPHVDKCRICNTK